MSQKYTNLIIIEQGANWITDLTLYQNMLYKETFKNYLDTRLRHIPSDVFEGLQSLIKEHISKDTLQSLANIVLKDYLTTPLRSELDTLFHATAPMDLTGKEVYIFIKIYKTSTGNKTLDYNYKATLTKADEGKVSFNIPYSDTMSMVHRFTRDETKPILGFYNLEVHDPVKDIVTRSLTGDVQVLQGAKTDGFHNSQNTQNP